MADWPDFSPGTLLRELVEGGVDFVVIGGVAIVLQAMPRFTKDLDICYASTRANLDALGEVLVKVQARLRGVEEEVPFVPDGRTLSHTQILCLTTSIGDIDLLVEPEGAPPYETLRHRADVMELAGQNIRVASINDMLAMKRAAGRPIDLTDIDALEAAKRLARAQRRSKG